MDDSELLARLKSGDWDAFETLLIRYNGMMNYIIRGILTDSREAEDCMALVQAKLWEKLSSYREERASLSTWITSVCRNAAYDRLRFLQRQTRQAAPLEDWIPDPAASPEELVLRQERREHLRKVLNALRDFDRKLFYRKYYYLQSTAQIAAELGLSERAVEGRLYRIRTRLQKLLGGNTL